MTPQGMSDVSYPSCAGAHCTCYEHCTDAALLQMVRDALEKADPSKVKFVHRYEQGWEHSREAQVRLAHLFRVPKCEPRAPSPMFGWVKLG